jgi:hypothetical protein
VLTVLPPGTRLRVHPLEDGTVLLVPARASSSQAQPTMRISPEKGWFDTSELEVS